MVQRGLVADTSINGSGENKNLIEDGAFIRGELKNNMGFDS